MSLVPTWPWLDPVADAVNPLLGVFLLFAWSRALWQHHPTRRMDIPQSLMLALVVAYGLTYVDRVWGLFTSIGLDFSTHGAVHWAALTAVLVTWPRAWRWALAVGLGYHGLMWAQGYHGAGDLAATTALVAGPLFGVWSIFRKRATATDRRVSNG